ncbi:MAG: hypothetical protein M3Y27_31910, partial [Acidobacteriota bacterium]|nr:hypothetical protein [Acidobacteriota bacterium]
RIALQRNLNRRRSRQEKRVKLLLLWLAVLLRLWLLLLLRLLGGRGAHAKCERHSPAGEKHAVSLVVWAPTRYALVRNAPRLRRATRTRVVLGAGWRVRAEVRPTAPQLELPRLLVGPTEPEQPLAGMPEHAAKAPNRRRMTRRRA